MSEWIGRARTNYVYFEDLDGLKEYLEPFDVRLAEKTNGHVTLHAIIAGGDDGWSGKFDFTQVTAFLHDDQVLVMIEAGCDGNQNPTGIAEAYNKAGESVSLSLTDIYALAANAFGVPQNGIALAKY